MLISLSTTRLVRPLLSISSTKQNRKGDKGSPYLSPFWQVKRPFCLPFLPMERWAKWIIILIYWQNLMLKNSIILEEFCNSIHNINLNNLLVHLIDIWTKTISIKGIIPVKIHNCILNFLSRMNDHEYNISLISYQMKNDFLK